MKSKNFVSLYWVSISFDISIANISWTVTQTSINHIIFWKSVMRTFRWIYANCFNRSKFLAEITTVLQNMHLFGQFKDHNSGRKHGKYTSDLIFCVYVLHSFFYLHGFFYLKILKIHFHVVLPLVNSGL